MHLTSALTVLSSALSVLALIVTYPNGDDQKNWVGASRAQEVKWEQPLDIQSIDIALTRQQPPYFQLIDRNVPIHRLPEIIQPPRGGWPVGEHFRVNLVKVDDPDTIYAQSNEFSIKNF